MNLHNTTRLVATVAASLAAAAALTFAGTAFAHDDCKEPGCAASEFIAHQKTKPVIVAHEAPQRILARAKDQCFTMEQSLRLD
jgi:hypothetical protein